MVLAIPIVPIIRLLQSRARGKRIGRNRLRRARLRSETGCFRVPPPEESPAMIEDNTPANSETNAANGIWADFMNWLSIRTGLGVRWLQCIGLIIGSLIAFLVSEKLHQTTWDSAALLFRIATGLAAVSAVVA